VNKVFSSLLLSKKTRNHPCLKEIDGNFELLFQILSVPFSDCAQAQITQNRSRSVLLILVIEVCR